MATNKRLTVVYGANQYGYGGSSSYFIDASRRPFSMSRAGGKFNLAFDMVVTGATQSDFAARCSELEAAFDPNQSQSQGLLIASDTNKYEVFCPCGGPAFYVTNYALISGKTFTVTLNGSAVVLTEGTSFSAVTSNATTAANLALAINATGSLGASGVKAVAVSPTSGTARVYLIAKWQNVTSLTTASNANSDYAGASANQGLGFNARPSIVKIGSEDDTALSRRYEITVTVDLPTIRINDNGASSSSRRDSTIQITETDSRRRRVLLTGTYTAFAESSVVTPSALEAYDNYVDTYCSAVLSALGGTWEGPLDADIRLDDEYNAGSASSRRLGKVLRYSRTYDELLYRQSTSATDDTRLRRQVLQVQRVISGPGDYGPFGRNTARLVRATVNYSAAVDKTVSTDLTGVYNSVVKPFLIDEAKRALDASSIAVTSHTPTIDPVENRISCVMEVMCATSGHLLESSVTTQDEDDPGVFLVSVWDGDPYSKEEFHGPKTLRRTVTQTYVMVTSKSGIPGALSSGGSAFGVINPNQPTAFRFASSGQEAAIDSFFFGFGGGGGQQDDFDISGGVARPDGLRAVYRGGVAVYEPVVIGRLGEPQLGLCRLTKIKAFEYIKTPKAVA